MWTVRWLKMSKLNQKGVTLLELILAMAIGSIVLSAIALVILTSSNTYAYSEMDISLQSETQIIMNQITDMILSSNNVKFDTTSGSDPILKIYTTDGTTEFPRKEIRFDQGKNQLLLKEIDDAAEHINSDTEPETLLGDFVKSINVTDTSADNNINMVVDLELETKVKKRTYYCKLSNIVVLRNQIVPLPTSPP